MDARTEACRSDVAKPLFSMMSMAFRDARGDEGSLLREVKTFVTVCRSGTFTAAAARLGMTQSAVSDHVQRLEGFVGSVLFHRTGRSATLNATGQDVLALAEEIVELTDRMRSGAAHGLIRGSLRVGTIASLHNTLLARAMIAFHRSHPSASVRLIRNEGSMLAQVDREELDMAVIVEPSAPLPRTMQWRPLLRKPFVLIVPADLQAPDWRAAVTALPLLRYEESSPSGRDVDDFLSRAGIEIRESVWINYLDTMITLVSQGLGVAFVPSTPLGDREALVNVIPLGAGTFYRTVGVLRRGMSPNGGALGDEFLATLQTEALREPHSETSD